ncbi:hypothetical protein [Pseudothermotoga sp.]|nr:hypothetical protein [Pseudothermotoga sp.]MCX7812292.1 hypothetical protein [Pseudothermotoga sp.]MDW8139362.1 hypothetical protein [Pseudothermotoga sp.]
MNKRLIVLLFVLVGVWGVAIYVLFFYQKSPTLATAAQRTESVIQPMIRRLNESEIERFRKNVEMPHPLVNVFEPYVMKLDKEKLMRQALSQLEVLPGYKFKGYFSSETENFVLLSDGTARSIGAILDGRYLIVHAMSFAAIVLDLSSGNLLVVR